MNKTNFNMKLKQIIYLLVILLSSCENKTIEIKNYGHSRNENIEKDANIVLSKFDNYRSLSKRIWALPCQDSIPKIILKDQHIIRNIYPIAVCEPPLFHPKQKHFIYLDNKKVYLNHFQDEINLDSLQFYFKNNFADYHNVDGYIKLTNYLVILEAQENINLDRVEKLLLKLVQEFDKLKTDKHLEILI